ncbi:MAG: glycosyltransferase, partial [Myxococcota bacterium]
MLVGAAAVAVHLLMLLWLRPRTATAAAVALFWVADSALVAVLAAAISPDGWSLAGAGYATVGLVAIRALPDWHALGRVFFGYLCAAAALYLIYVAELTLFGGLGAGAAGLSALLLLFEALAILLTLTYAYEGLSTLARVRWRRVMPRPAAFTGEEAPLVSIHVPTYSEPPELVIETLEALARLDYPRFEVIVVDNNTQDAALWRPVERRCAELGPRFRFFHVSPLAGFKAGACNFALARTDPQAEIIAIIDADYVVVPEFLTETAPYFRDPRIAFVQTPQDYREFSGNRYLTDCLHAYAYFFAVSMRTRNEDNAAIFGGTMGLIRRSALEEIGGWDEWCITEDAEASLRILQRGHASLYIHKSYGRGLMPFEFDAYKKQRFRWAFGGVQILRKHWRSLVPFVTRPPGDRLTAAQRAWYLVAGLLWFGEPLQVAFAAFLTAGGLAYALGAGTLARPLAEAILVFPLLFLGLGVVRFLWVLRTALGLGLRDAVGAALSMFSLSWVVTQAALLALVRSGGVFLRTSKTRSTSTLGRALHAARVETALAAACLAVAALALARGLTPLAIGIAALAAWQAILYGSA